MNFFNLPPELSTQVLNLNRKNVSRTDEFSFIVARCMAYRAQMDQAADRDSNVRGLMNPKFDSVLSSINSLLPLNFQKIRDYVRAWGSFRHDNVVGCLGAPYARIESEEEDFFGISRHFDAAIIRRVKECPDTLTQYHVAVHKLIEFFESQNQGAGDSPVAA